MSKLTHFDQSGQAHMVDVGDKDKTRRIAITRGEISMLPETLQMVSEGTHKKGDVLAIARIAAIMAAKKTADIIPLCHPIGLTHISIEFVIDETHNKIVCTARTETVERTGVEMEALCAVNAGLLTIYDMCKAVDRGMVISDLRLLEKSGGKSGHWQHED